VFVTEEKTARMIITHPKNKEEVIRQIENFLQNKRIKISEQNSKIIIRKTCSFLQQKEDAKKVSLNHFLERMINISFSLQNSTDKEIPIEVFFQNLKTN
jgi:hypothetical protein